MPEIPRFESEDDEAEFWDTHSTVDYLEDSEPLSVEVSPDLKAAVQARAKQRVTLRLERSQISAAKAIARKKGLPYQTLIRMWIHEAIQRELAASPAGARRARTRRPPAPPERP